MLQRSTLLRTTVAGLIVGTTLLGAAWAGIVVAPTEDPTGLLGAVGGSLAGGAGDDGATAAASAPAGLPATTVGLLAGAAKTSIAPRPDDYGGTWVTDPATCRTLDPGFLQHLGTTPEDAAHLAHTGSPWPENPDCIYQGGFGLGPMNPVSSFDEELGLWVRSIAVGDGTDTIVLTVIDGEGWM